MTQSSFSDISIGSIQQDQFDCERKLFTLDPNTQSPSINSIQKVNGENIQTNCSNKSDIIYSGSFMKGLERFTQELSYEESVYDIYYSKDECFTPNNLNTLKSNKELSNKYIMVFNKSKSKNKSNTISKIRTQRSNQSSKKNNFPKPSTLSNPHQQYFTSKSKVRSPKNYKLKTDTIQKQSSLNKRSTSKQSHYRSKSKIQMNKKKFIQNKSSKSTIPYK